MAAPMIDVRKLSKSYVIGHAGPHAYKRLSESMVSWVAHPVRSAREARKEKELFWALKDVSFSVDEGEVVGLIGKNGAGKSTVLKVMSKITYPSEGEIRLRGRVGSLLEVGTGFHPELSGRENIFMNGAILGMRKAEIEANFDDIVKFAEMEKFLDTPVKRYSSGMYVRLAFAVAAHLQPEILLVDEVLAVGDAQFQKKCLGKIQDVSRGGKTVMFVSHNMPTVEGLCDRAVLIEEGKVRSVGEPRDVISEYMRIMSMYKGNDLTDASLKRLGDGEATFTRIEVVDEEGKEAASVVENRPFKVVLTLKASTSTQISNIGMNVVDRLGRNVLVTLLNDSVPVSHLDKGEYRLTIHVDPNPFIRGSFALGLFCQGAGGTDHDKIDHAYNLNVVPNLGEDGPSRKMWGVVNLPFEWSLDRQK